jgi:hypothetical protein
MPRHLRIEETEAGRVVVRLTSHRRTLTETDIVSFETNGLHEPPFIDMNTSRGCPGGITSALLQRRC